MDVKVGGQPLTLGGIHWSGANRWFIGTPGRVFIVTPQFMLAGEIPRKHEVTVAIEAECNVEALCLLDDLPSNFPFANAAVVLASDSSIRVLASKHNPDLSNWQEMGRGGFGMGSELVYAISSTIFANSSNDATPVVACGSVGGRVTVVGLDVASDDSVYASRVLTFETKQTEITQLAWLQKNQQQQQQPGNRGLAVCSTDGQVQLWSIAEDLSQATALASICNRDWRAVTAHAESENLLVLGKLGLAIVVDTRDIQHPIVHEIELDPSMTVVACVIDEHRQRIYIGTYDFKIYVLAPSDGSWRRATKEEKPLLDDMRETVVRSFTTEFNMQRLFLRGMRISPHGRYLAFAVDDQVNWDLVTDGKTIVRIHFHQFSDWTLDDSKRALVRIVDGNCSGDLRYNLWDVFNNEPLSVIAELIEHLKQLDIPSSAAIRQQRRIVILNLINCLVGGDQLKQLVAEAPDRALDHHVKALFEYIHSTLGSKAGAVTGKAMVLLFADTTAPLAVVVEEDQAYLAQINWLVHRPEYAHIVDQLPSILDNAGRREPLTCPVCQEGVDICSVTLGIFNTPGSSQCGMCVAKRKQVEDGHCKSLVSRIIDMFPQCPFCKGSFYPAA
ncbi:hypothetical protein H4R20_004271, partial [Coemansia guatemalensis]